MYAKCFKSNHILTFEAPLPPLPLKQKWGAWVIAVVVTKGVSNGWRMAVCSNVWRVAVVMVATCEG